MYCWVVAFFCAEARVTDGRHPGVGGNLATYADVPGSLGRRWSAWLAAICLVVVVVVVVTLPLNWRCVTNQVLEVIERLVLYKKRGSGKLELQSGQSSDVEALFGARIASVHLACSQVWTINNSLIVPLELDPCLHLGYRGWAPTS